MRRFAVVTGANSGIGHPLSVMLAEAGYDLLLFNRNRATSQSLLDALRAARPGVVAEVIETDLADHSSIRRSCAVVAERAPRLSLLLNNAGVLTKTRRISPQGQEGHFQVNTLSPWLIMKTLRPQLAAAGEARILNTGSSAMSEPFVGPLRVDRLTDPRRMDIMGAYAQSKLALAVLGEIAAPELQRDGIIIRTACPGANRTTMTAKGDGMPWILQILVPLFFSNPVKGAAALYGALFDAKFGNRSGIYVEKGKIKSLPNKVSDPALRDQLLSFVERLTVESGVTPTANKGVDGIPVGMSKSAS